MSSFVIRYLFFMTCITFCFRGRDKWQATRQRRRVSEKQLLWLVILGGGIGALLGQHFFRHKTIKGPFVWKIYVIILIRISVVIVTTSI